MNGKHYAQTTSQQERACSLIHGSWRRVGIRIAAAGACALMAGQLLLPSVALATELEGAAATSTEATATAVVPSTPVDGADSANGSTSAPVAWNGSAVSQLPAADTQPAAGAQGAQVGASDTVAPLSSGEASGGASNGQAASGTANATTSGVQTQGVSDGSGGTAIINEIRDDYYTRHHVWVKFQLVVPAAESSTISTATVINAKTDYAPGETPRATATVPAADADKYEIAYECWEEMSGDDPRDLQPVAYWYSDVGKYPTGAKRITQFEEGKFYMYSVALRLKGDTALDPGFDVTVNGRPGGTVLRTVDGVLLPNAASMLCEQPIGEEQAIDMVEIDGATTTFKAGDKPVFTAGVSGASNSIFQCEFWMGNDGGEVNSQKFWDENITNHIDAFKAGVTYRYGFDLKAQRGCYFTRDTKVKVNGRLYSFEWSESDKEAFERWDGKSDTMWVYTDLTMTPESAPAPIDPEKPNPGGSETPATKPSDKPAQKTDGKTGDSAKTPAVGKDAKGGTTTAPATALAGKDANGTALAATGDDAALTVVAMGVAGATVAAAGIAATRRRNS